MPQLSLITSSVIAGKRTQKYAIGGRIGPFRQLQAKPKQAAQR